MLLLLLYFDAYTVLYDKEHFSILHSLSLLYKITMWIGAWFVRILFLSPYPASLMRSRLYGVVTHLARQHQIEMLTPCTSMRELAEVQALQQAGFTITAQSEHVLQGMLRSVGALPSGQPLQVAFCASSGLRAALQERLLDGKFDLLHVESIRALGILPTRVPIPVVWDAVDCISQLYAQGRQTGATWRLRLLGSLESARVRAYEQQQLRRFRQILVTAERERRALLATAPTHNSSKPRSTLQGNLAEITVLPHGIDRAYFQPYSGKRQHETLIFSGKMDFHANIAAVRLLVQQIMPRIWRQRPDVRLVIAGSNPPAQIRRLARDPRDPRIEVTGYLPDLRLAISQAQVAVCPLPYAVGIQNKILEAMALGTPVVTSSAAASGLQVTAGKDLLVADEPEAFAHAVLRLLDDFALWQSLAEHGISYITAHHDWNTIIHKLITIYQQAIAIA